MHIEVSSSKAKAKLSDLMRGVQHGNRYTITLRGKAIADLVPVQGNQPSDTTVAVEEMYSFMQARMPTANVDFKTLVNDGRG